MTQVNRGHFSLEFLLLGLVWSGLVWSGLTYLVNLTTYRPGP